MYVIRAKSINDALAKGLRLIENHAEPVDSRNGMTLEVPEPVATVYENPERRVLVSSARDANPFFHLMEALWIIAGRQDVKFLTEFNKRMGEYSDDGKVFNAPYGYRLRHGFGGEDQLINVAKVLSDDPNSRQAVLQIWDPQDLTKTTLDKACNMSMVFRIRNGELCLTVYNRSNDMVWGAYGANVVQFSMLQEYVAALLGLGMGSYTQVSNSFHVYTEGAGGAVFDRIETGFDRGYDPYLYVNNLMNIADDSIVYFNDDLATLFNMYDFGGLSSVVENMQVCQSNYFQKLVVPMIQTYLTHKTEGPEKALSLTPAIVADDWRMAAVTWLETRIENRSKN